MIWLRPNWFKCLHLDDIFYFYMWTKGLALLNTWNFKEWELYLLTVCWLADFEKNHSCLVLFMFGNKTQVWLWPILNTGQGSLEFWVVGRFYKLWNRSSRGGLVVELWTDNTLPSALMTSPYLIQNHTPTPRSNLRQPQTCPCTNTMHHPCTNAMHSPDCLSTKTQIPPHLTCTLYMILLLRTGSEYIGQMSWRDLNLL